MKKFSKILSVALLVALVLSLGVANAFAADEPNPATTKHTITITNDNFTGAHTFNAYQVFAGKYVESGDLAGQLQEITWGSGVNGTALLAALKADTTIGSLFENATDAHTAAAAMGKMTNDSAQAERLAEVIEANLTETVAGTGSGTDTFTIEVTGDGYYFLKDVTETMPAGDSYSRYILQVVHDVTAAAKSETVTSDKKVKDVNDSKAASETNPTGWQKSADYDIGDHVPFQLTGTLPSNYDKYDTYTYIFHDQESKGLTFDNNAKVYVNGVEITTGFTVVTTGLEDGCTFEVRFTDLKTLKDSNNQPLINKDSVITVEYTSELNSSAVIGNPGNPNESWLEYSNNPNAGGDGTGTTPKKTAIVFTFKLEVNKKDEAGNALKGAGFTLYKKYPAGTAGIDEDGYKAVGTEIVGGDTTTFGFNGLDDGEYKLVETTVPEGYNKMADVVFEIVAEHGELITKLNGKTETGEIELGTMKATVNPGAGSFTSDVVNQSGTVLPSTGGIGTTIFYVVGGVLVLAAIILLVTKKRMSE